MKFTLNVDFPDWYFPLHIYKHNFEMQTSISFPPIRVQSSILFLDFIYKWLVLQFCNSTYCTSLHLQHFKHAFKVLIHTHTVTANDGINYPSILQFYLHPNSNLNMHSYLYNDSKWRNKSWSELSINSASPFTS